MQKHTKTPFFTKTKIILILVGGVTLLGIFGFAKVTQVKGQIKELFQLNKALQEQNYYMAEFEFKMLGIAYCLDKGMYDKASSLFDRLYQQLKSKEGLVKVPVFANKEAELEFYLNLQNPRTGAFMDDAYPLGTYHGPTENVLLHLDALAEEIGTPLQLKYPLKYLDEINTSQKLITFLEDVSTVGAIATQFPQTSFHNARDLLSLARDPLHYDENEVQMVVHKHHLYQFSSEWRQTLLQWFYDNQDPETGLWGPKSEEGKLLKKDLSNTASIMKAFVDRNGNSIHPNFPLRYKNELFDSILDGLSGELPAQGDWAEWHEWHLKTLKGLRTLTRYLWKDASFEHKAQTRSLFETFIKIQFDNYYIPQEGAFSYYPGSEQATLDGAGGLSIFKEIGAFSSEKQEKLWGTFQETLVDLGTAEISQLTHEDFAWLANADTINSLRFYSTPPKEWTEDVVAVGYPRETVILDIVDLTQNMKRWLATTPQTMGNWVSKEEVRQQLARIKSENVPIYQDANLLESANDLLRQNHKLIVFGFDVLQLPRYQMIYILQ